jgi:hypothetical protein
MSASVTSNAGPSRNASRATILSQPSATSLDFLQFPLASFLARHLPMFLQLATT